MGEFRERDAQGKDDFSGLDEINREQNERKTHNGALNFEGIDQALERMREQDTEDSQELEEPERVLPSDEINFEDIRERANYTYFVNSQDHIDTPENRELAIDIGPDYERLTDSLMGYLREDNGVEALYGHATGELEEETHWANLIALGLIEGEQELSTLGEYVSQQAFEYSE